MVKAFRVARSLTDGGGGGGGGGEARATTGLFDINFQDGVEGEGEGRGRGREERRERGRESGITIGSISAFLSVPLSIFIDVSPEKNIIKTVRSVFIQEDALCSV